MSNVQQQVTINLDEHITFDQQVDAVETLMELLGMDFESDVVNEEHIIKVKYPNRNILNDAIEKYQRMIVQN